MAVPALLLPVDSQIYIDARRLHPDLLNLLKLHQIVRGTGTVENVYRTVIVPVIQHVVDDRAKGRKTDSSGDKQKILLLQRCLHRKGISVGTAHGNLVSHIHSMQVICQGAAALNAELLIFFVGGGRCDREHRLAHTGNRYHGTLTRHMLKKLLAVSSHYPEGFNVRSFRADIRHHANHRNQRVYSDIICVSAAGTFTHFPHLPVS